MKTLTLFFLLTCTLNSIGQKVSFTKGDVRFIQGDNPSYSEPDFNDSEWKKIRLGANWETQGHEGYDGYAWYRIKIKIPSDLKQAAIENKGLMLNLGAIDDAEISFFNGKRIGSTGGFPPQYYSAWNSRRRYRIAIDQIKWDQFNVIAIRVYDAQQGGGMYAGPYAIEPAGWKDNVYINISSIAPSFIFKEGQTAAFSVSLKNGTGNKFNGTLKSIYTSDLNEAYGAKSDSVLLETDAHKTFQLSKHFIKPGFYEVAFQLKKVGDTTTTIATSVFGYAIEKIKVQPDPQKDFNAYWQQTRMELNNIPPEYKMTHSSEWSTSSLNVYLIELKSLGNVLIRGWYSVPKKQIKHPGLLRIPGHSVNILPDTTIKDFAVLALNIRGHGNSSDAIHPGFPGYITHGLQNKYSYIYRGAYMDGIRGLDFLYSQAEVDTSRIAVEGHSQGGGISIALAALDHRIKAIAPDQPFLSDFRNYFKIAPWPKSEFSAFANTHFKGAMDSVYTILSYIDIKNLAPLVHCPVIMLVGLKDETCPPEINFAAFNNISSKNKEYRIYPEAIHELPSGYYKIKMNWIRQLFKMPETVN